MRGARKRLLKYLLCLCLALVWAVLTLGPLARKWPPVARWFGWGPEADVRTTPDGTAEGSRRVAIYFGDRRVGDLDQQWRREGDRLETRTPARVNLNAMAGVRAGRGDFTRPHGLSEDPVVVHIVGNVVCRRGLLQRLRFQASLSHNVAPFLVADANPVLDKIVMRIRASLYPFVLLLVNAAFFTMVASLVAEWCYDRAFLEAQNTRSKKKRHGRRLLVGLIDLFLPAVSRFKRELILKDLRTFLRSPAQWRQVLIFVGILAIYFMNVGSIHTLGTGVISRDDCSFLNFVAVAMTLCTLTIRFAFPMISLEGQNLWVLGLVPVERYEILEAKFLSILVANLVCGATLMALSDLILRASPLILFLHLIAMVVLSFGLTALSVGLGAIFPSFKEINPAKIASGVGGTINLTLCLAFAAGVVILLVLPFHTGGHTAQEWGRTLWDNRLPLAFSAIIGTAILSWGVVCAGARALENVER